MTGSYTFNESEKTLLSSVQLWLSRLQLVTVVTAFFASTDGLLLGRVGAYDTANTSVGNILTHTALSGALALHVSAAIIAYLASFVLVKYNRISVPASGEDSVGTPGHNPQQGREKAPTSPGGSVKIPQPDHPMGLQSLGQHPVTGAFNPMITIERVYLRNFFRTRPSASLFYASSSGPDTVTAPELQDAHNMLVRSNSVCVLLTFVGLLLAILGIMAYVWTTFTLASGIFVSVCFIVGLITACYALR
ncbi:hypothetical protein BDM02DRAFT_2631671 [Thelephora ganbajun]|uniref:Uncharacterized protein n=1 Tax=Thelephora ganbajun TaxID=370292 RepID=A0ACB6ZSJ8_THEGA|nr:hypothetical protein BDM02DRAFT_2631671 [Thelephora ganbajun]